MLRLSKDYRNKRMWPRWLACVLAFFTGYFWARCPTCGRMFAGFESGGPAAYSGGGCFLVGCCECSSMDYHYEKDEKGDSKVVIP